MGRHLPWVRAFHGCPPSIGHSRCRASLSLDLSCGLRSVIAGRRSLQALRLRDRGSRPTGTRLSAVRRGASDGPGTVRGERPPTGALDFPAEYRSMAPRTLSLLGISKVMTVTSTYDHRPQALRDAEVDRRSRVTGLGLYMRTPYDCEHRRADFSPHTPNA
jgi:hypothetical protein